MQRLRKTLAELFVANRKVYGSPRLAVCLQGWASPAAATGWPGTCAPCTSKPAKNGPLNPKPPTANHPHPIARNLLGGTAKAQVSQSRLGQRHHLCLHRPRLALSGRRHGPLQPQNRRLGHQRSLETALVKAALQQAMG